MNFKRDKKQLKQKTGKFSIPKINLRKKGIPLKFKFLVGFLTIAFLSGGMFIILFYISQWYDVHQILFQTPIVVTVRTPIIIEKRKAIIVSKIIDPVVENVHAEGIVQVPSWKIRPDEVNKEEWEYIVKQPYARLLIHIWQKESDYGRDQIMGSLDNYCRSHGEENQFGLGGMRDMTCFDTFEDNVQAVIKTLNSYGKLDEKTMGCIYNLGIRENNCPYMAGY